MTTIQNQERTREQYDYIDFHSYVIDAPFIYGLTNGVGYALGFIGLGLVICFFTGRPLVWWFFTGLMCLGLSIGFIQGERLMRWSLFKFDEMSLRNREITITTRQEGDEDPAPPVSGEAVDRRPVQIASNHYVVPGRHYRFTDKQRASFSIFNTGDTISRRRLEKDPAWKGKNIAHVWSNVRQELQRLQFIDADSQWTDTCRQWASPTHPEG